MDVDGDKIIKWMMLVMVMVSPNDKAPAETTFGNCLSRPRTRSFYDTSSDLIALTKRGASGIPHQLPALFVYPEGYKIGFPFGAYA